jgi:hypothetical protein
MNYIDTFKEVKVECDGLARELERAIREFEIKTGIPVFVSIDSLETKQLGGSPKPFVQNISVKPYL